MALQESVALSFLIDHVEQLELVSPRPTTSVTSTSGPQIFAQGDVNKILSTTSAGLSMMGALVIIITFVIWPDLRTYTRKIILFISIGDFFVALSNILGVYGGQSNLTCKMEATLNVVAVLSSFFWTVYLSVYFYLTVCRKITLEVEARLMRLFHVTAWGIPLLLAAIAIGDKALGNSKDFVSSGWCWIKYEKGGKWWKMVLWMFIAGKGWEILAYITIAAFYVLVKLEIRREMKMGIASARHLLTLKSLEVVKKADRKLTFIPVVFILLRIWGTIRFIRFLAYHGNPPAEKWLVILHGIGDSGQGFANFILFCLFTDKIRKKFRQCFTRLIPRCNVQEKDPLLESTNLANGARDYNT